MRYDTGRPRAVIRLRISHRADLDFAEHFLQSLAGKAEREANKSKK